MAKKNTAREACLFCGESPCICNKKPKTKKGGKSATDGVTQSDDSGVSRGV